MSFIEILSLEGQLYHIDLLLNLNDEISLTGKGSYTFSGVQQLLIELGHFLRPELACLNPTNTLHH